MFYATLAALAAALLLFAILGLRASRAGDALDDYMTARNSQPATTLGLSFLASGMGAWILFAPPEVGAFVGPVALAGYAIGSALPFLVLALCGPAIRRCLPEGRSIGEFAAARFGSGVRRYVAIYHLNSPDITRSDAWKTAVDTPWSARLRPHFRDHLRILTKRYVREN